MSSAIVPHIAKALTSSKLLNLKRALAEKKRMRKKQPHLVTVYLRINDPYSYLLLQVLDQLKMRYPIKYDFRTVFNLQQEMYPAPELWEKNAFNDGAYLSELYELEFPQQRPETTPERDAQLTAQLLHWELQPGYLANALQLFHAYWQQDPAKIDTLVSSAIPDHVECYQHHLAENETMLKDMGHYLSAMLHYGGEWYWGLDRLEHLERRFNDMGLDQTGSSHVYFNRGYREFCAQMSPAQIIKTTSDTPIEIFWSIRSPYSYVGLLRAKQLANYYQVPLVVKPVLPMVMRRMKVPKSKRFYIAMDTKREADKYDIDFGFIADPLGDGVERCYALYEFAKSEGKGVEYLESYARGVWAEGIRSDTDKGLQKIVERVGLNWQQAKPQLQDDSWRIWVQQNLAEIYQNDLWGVPSFKYGEVKVFGQDRIDCIERAIVRNLTGINVVEEAL